MIYYEQFKEIAESGNVEVIQETIRRFEEQVFQCGETEEVTRILDMLRKAIEPDNVYHLIAHSIHG